MCLQASTAVCRATIRHWLIIMKNVCLPIFSEQLSRVEWALALETGEWLGLIKRPEYDGVERCVHPVCPPHPAPTAGAAGSSITRVNEVTALSLVLQ